MAHEAAALSLPYFGTVKRYALDYAARAALPLAQEALKSAFGYGRPGYGPQRVKPRYSGPARMDFSRDYMGRSKFRNPSTRNTGYFGAGEREAKFHDKSENFNIPIEGSISASLNLIAQGVTECDRIGRRITIRELYIHFNFFLQTSGQGTNTSDTVRIIIFIDKQANGATAGVNDILQEVTPGMNDANFLSHLNLSNMDRFRILEDHTMSLNAASAGVDAGGALISGNTSRTRFFRTPMKLDIEYSNSAAEIEAVSSNNLAILTICSNDDFTRIKWNSRIRYTG